MFKPIFSITSNIANNLMRIEAVRQAIKLLPITPKILATLRESARISATHYSTKIEGNRLTEKQVAQVIKDQQHFPGRERDEKEILGYYEALEEIEKLASLKRPITEKEIQRIHAFVMGGGKKRVKPSLYRDGQNVIRDGLTHAIVYLPPEAHDVPQLMHDLIDWLKKAEKKELPCPLRAGIAHYEYATIHPYYDGNGRTARLLTTLILHMCGYGLKGIYSLDEYYAQNLSAYYQALTIGPSHNYYLGRAQADITPWLEYFCAGMAESFEKIHAQALHAFKDGNKDSSDVLRALDAKQRKILLLFAKHDLITTKDVALLFTIKPRTARQWCLEWSQKGFLIIADSAKKSRTYQLSPRLRKLI